MIEAIKEIGEVMRVNLKMKDVFYNNGITNVFWATKRAYEAEYEKKNNSLQMEVEGVKLALTPFFLEIEGEDKNIRGWYRKIGSFLTETGLADIKRLVYDRDKCTLEEGYSYGGKAFASRTWGTSIGSKFISAPSLWKNFSREERKEIETAVDEYLEKSGKDLRQLKNDKLFKEKWGKEGVYISIPKEKIIDKLLGKRDELGTGKNLCEICNSPYTIYGEKEIFKRDTAIVPTVIGLDYSGFKDLAIGKNLICAFCDAVLRYNFFFTFYAKSGKRNIVLHLDIPDLVALFQLKEFFEIEMEDITGKDIKQSTNIPYQGFYLSSTERAILALSLFTYEQIKERKGDENLQLLFAKKKDIIQIVGIFFDAQGIYQFIQYHKLSRFLEFLNSLPGTKFLPNSLKAGTFNLIKGEHRDLYEKSFLSNLLEFHPIAYNLSQIAFLKIKGDIYPSYLSRDFEEMVITFYQFLKKEETMEQEAIELIRKYGWGLGTIAKTIEDKGVFYELRDAKQPEHFIRVLRDFSFKMVKKAEELKGQFDAAALNTFTGKDQAFINLLNEKEDRWEEIRDLLAFFSVNTYLKGMPSGDKQSS